MEGHIVPLKEGHYEASREKRIVLFALILALLSFAGCVTLSVLEILSFRPQTTAFPLKSKTVAQVQPALKPEIHPLSFLPDEIEEFLTNAKHPVPGYEGYMAEAIYQPETEELSSVAPVNSYVKVSFFERAWDAEKAIKDDLTERYPEGHQTVDLGGQKASFGYEQNRKSFFIGWSVGRYAIEIDTSFVSGVPGTKGTVLYETGNKVAAAVQGQIADVWSKKK